MAPLDPYFAFWLLSTSDQPIIVSAEQCNRCRRTDPSNVLLNPTFLVSEGFRGALGNQQITQLLASCEMNFAVQMDMTEFIISNIEINAVHTCMI